MGRNNVSKGIQHTHREGRKLQVHREIRDSQGVPTFESPGYDEAPTHSIYFLSTSGLMTTSSYNEESYSDQSVLDYFLPYLTHPLEQIAVDPTIFSLNCARLVEDNSQMSASTVEATKTEPQDYRSIPPTLPAPIYRSSITHAEKFSSYLQAEGLNLHPHSASGATEQSAQFSTECSKSYSNVYQIAALNSDRKHVFMGAPLLWVEKSLLADDMHSHLPVPFNDDLVTNCPELWSSQQRFTTTLDTSSEKSAKQWLNNIARMLGQVHGVKQASKYEASSNQASSTQASSTQADHPPTSSTTATVSTNRVFDEYGHNKPLGGEIYKCKPDIILINKYALSESEGQISWGIVQGLVEISIQESHLSAILSTIISKATNIFHAQLQRRYFLGLGVCGVGPKQRFFLVYVDRTAVICTEPAFLQGYQALTLGRILYAMMYGSDTILGIDTRVKFHHLTGIPYQVCIDNKLFDIVKELHISPYLFGRGTRVYIVKDQYGYFHVFKDSWILCTHKHTEMAIMKLVSDKAKEKLRDDPRLRYLMTRFVAGDDCVDDTAKVLGYLPSFGIVPRIRRRIVSGPIGDPITSYRSRTECIQAFADIIKFLAFMEKECLWVHCDISIENLAIVRFLPSVVSAADSFFDADVSSTSAVASTPVTTGPSTGLDYTNSYYVDEDNNRMPWNAVSPVGCDGFTHSLGSGGTVIDFDYSRPVNTPSSHTSGTRPFMSIELMNPAGPTVHRLGHDLESVIMVLLHIICFTCGPTGSVLTADKNKAGYTVAVWHHESELPMLQRLKLLDIGLLASHPETYVTEYWAPIAPFITELINIVYPQITTIGMTNGQPSMQPIHDVFTRILEKCRKLDETPVNYAAFKVPVRNSTKKRKNRDEDGDKNDKQPRNGSFVIPRGFESRNPLGIANFPGQSA